MEAITSTTTEPKFHLTSVNTDNFIEKVSDKVIEKWEDRRKKELFEKLLSPEKTCNLFDPKISKVTLHKWTKEGRLQEYRIGGRIYYKYSEVINSLHTLKKYKKS